MNDVILLLQKIESQLCQLKEVSGIYGITTESPPVAPPAPGAPIIVTNPVTLQQWIWDGDSWEAPTNSLAVISSNLSSAEILNLFTVPKIIIPAQVGKAAIVYMTFLEVFVGSTLYTGGGNSFLTNGSGQLTNNIPNTAFTASASSKRYLIPTTSALAPANAAVRFTNVTGPFLGGNGTGKLTVYYQMQAV